MAVAEWAGREGGRCVQTQGKEGMDGVGLCKPWSGGAVG